MRHKGFWLMCLQKEVSSLSRLRLYDCIQEDSLVLKIRHAGCSCCSRSGLRLRKNGTVFKHSRRRTSSQTCVGSGQPPATINVTCPYCSRNTTAATQEGGSFVLVAHTKTVFSSGKPGYHTVTCEGSGLCGNLDAAKKLLML